MTFNGWTNWDTWCTVLWADNEYSLYQSKVTTLKAINEQKANGTYNNTLARLELRRVAKEAACYAHTQGDAIENKLVNWPEIEEAWLAEAEEYKEATK